MLSVLRRAALAIFSGVVGFMLLQSQRRGYRFSWYGIDAPLSTTIQVEYTIDMIRAVVFDCFGVLCDARGRRYEHVVDFVRQTRRSHKTAMLSNVNRQFVDGLFTRSEMAELFDTVVISGEAGLAKPNELIYELTATKLGLLPEECVMIDDSELNVNGALAAGMQGIVFATLEQCQTDLNELLEKNNA